MGQRRAQQENELQCRSNTSVLVSDRSSAVVEYGGSRNREEKLKSESSLFDTKDPKDKAPAKVDIMLC